MKRLLEAVLRHPAKVLALSGLLVAACAVGLARLESDNSPWVFFRRDAESLTVFRDFEREFGSDEMSRLVLRGPGVFTAAGAAYVRELASAAREVPGVVEVLSPFDVPGSDQKIAPAAAPKSAADPWASVRADPLALALGLVAPTDAAASADTAAASLLVSSRPGEPRRRDAMLAGLDQRMARPPDGVVAEGVGMPYLARAFDGSAGEIGTVWFPILALVASALLGFLFRAWRWVVAPLAFVGACETVTLGVAGATGAKLNLVVAILPPLLFVIALATAIHLATRVRALRGGGDEGLSAEAATLTAYSEKGSAILWTSLSAGVGFGSLAFTPVGPVADLGRLAAFGLLVLGGLAFTLLPVLLRWAARDVVGRRDEESLGSLGAGFASRAAARIGPVLLAVIGLAILAGLGLPRLRVENDSLRYLPAEHPIRRAFADAEASGIGVSAIELRLTAASAAAESASAGAGAASGGERFDDGAGVQRLAWCALRMREELAELGVLSAVGPGEWVESALRSTAQGRAAAGGSAPRDAALRALLETEGGRRIWSSLVSADGRRARLTLFVRSGGYDEFDRVVDAARGVLAEELPGVGVEATGVYSLLLDTQRSLLATLGRSLAITVAGISAILYVLLRRVRLTLLALIPNVLPAWLILGLMGWFGVPLDLATVMVASTTLGLALDDTLHTLVPFRRHVGEKGTFEALLHAVEKNAAAYSASGLVLGLGFAVCSLSSFAPIRRFGALSALAIGLAVLADFLLVPALLGGLPAHWVTRKHKDRAAGQ